MVWRNSALDEGAGEGEDGEGGGGRLGRRVSRGTYFEGGGRHAAGQPAGLVWVEVKVRSRQDAPHFSRSAVVSFEAGL